MTEAPERIVALDMERSCPVDDGAHEVVPLASTMTLGGVPGGKLTGAASPASLKGNE